MTPIERLIQQEALVDLILVHNYIPQKSAQNFNELIAALREFNPSGRYEPGCSGCMMEIAHSAKLFINSERDRMNKMMSDAIFMTFPEHPQEPVKKKPGRPKK